MWSRHLLQYFFLLLTTFLPCLATVSKQPHIILILADDLGFNDVGFRGSKEIPTPNIDALAYSGVILNKYYVYPLCTPSRSALMTGKEAIHTGMQSTVLFGAEPRGLPLTERLLPEHLNRLGYVSRAVGKWHLGSYLSQYTPTYRGFCSHLGYWTGHQDYYDHTASETGFWGLDMRRNMEVARDLHGQYSTHVFTDESVKIIKNHNSTQPLFLYLAHVATHSGNPYNPLPAPDKTVASMSHIDNYNRKRFAGIMSELDTSVGLVVEALKKANMLENSIIIFSTDNGGAADGFNLNYASNWPLRGVKNTLWEGGVRGAGLIWSPLLRNPGRVSNEMMHMTDWLPTLYTAAGGNVADLGKIDGINQWETLQQGVPTKRTRVLHNIDDRIFKHAAITIGKWKYMEGTTYFGQWDGWFGPSGRDDKYQYNIGQVMGSRTHRALSPLFGSISPDKVRKIREETAVNCSAERTSNEARFSNCQPLVAPCLFDIEADPCEMNNLANKYPDILAELSKELRKANATAIPAGNLPIDPRGDPRNFNYVWTNFGDCIEKPTAAPQAILV